MGARKSGAVLRDFRAIVADDWTVTLPAEIREFWGLKAGDKVEFFQDHTGAWQLRPRNAGPLDFLDCLPPRPKRSDVQSDDDALAKALSERNLPPSAMKAAG